ncbi:hypothetical protein LZ554_009405 [Drepanopeziza brunnea f. sp. 'monogermtubi']|nr:hypothetical protein LZ554_009405 [Drepanopeziza brunnea f. sp. 'monogermtubi']
MFVKNGVDVSVQIYPLTDTSALDLQFSKGHRIDSFLNSCARVLSGEDLAEEQMKGVQIFRVGLEDAEEFVRQSVDGYQDLCRAETVPQTIARSAILRDDTTDYVATVDGKVAASAGMALIEISLAGVAHMAFDSTLPAIRGRGIQAALLNARFADAGEAGFDLACALARPGNGGYRNLERVGSSLAYTTA